MTSGTDAPEGFAAALSQSGLTQEQAARVCGVSSRTLRNWAAGKTAAPQSALAALAAFGRAPLDQADSPLAERIAALEAAQAIHWHRVCQLEDDLAAARSQLEQCNRRLNALYAERGKAA